MELFKIRISPVPCTTYSLKKNRTPGAGIPSFFPDGFFACSHGKKDSLNLHGHMQTDCLD